jgi:hypothetical protein
MTQSLCLTIQELGHQKTIKATEDRGSGRLEPYVPGVTINPQSSFLETTTLANPWGRPRFLHSLLMKSLLTECGLDLSISVEKANTGTHTKG